MYPITYFMLTSVDYVIIILSTAMVPSKQSRNSLLNILDSLSHSIGTDDFLYFSLPTVTIPVSKTMFGIS